MCEQRQLNGLLFLAWAFSGLLLSAPAGAQDADTAPVPWQKIETWALGPADGRAVVKDQPKDLAKETPGDVAKDTPKDVVKETPKDSAKDAPKDLAKESPKDSVGPAPTWTSRAGERRPDPPGYKAMLEQVNLVMGQRLKDPRNSSYRRQAEIYLFVEQYERALELLTRVPSDKRLREKDLKEDIAWSQGKIWECALFCQKKVSQDWIKQQYGEWKTREQERIKAYSLKDSVNKWTLEQMEKSFAERQSYYEKDGLTIAEKIKDLELRGDTSPGPLVELKDRLIDKRPEAPLTLMRVLYKLREWYPDLPIVKSGAVSYTLARHLGTKGVDFYREASAELEDLMKKIPTGVEASNGDWLYHAGECAYQHAEHLAPDPHDGWSVSDRNRPVYKEAKEYWELARQNFQRLKMEYPKHWGLKPNWEGHTDVDIRLSAISELRRLGPAKKP